MDQSAGRNGRRVVPRVLFGVALFLWPATGVFIQFGTPFGRNTFIYGANLALVVSITCWLVANLAEKPRWALIMRAAAYATLCIHGTALYYVAYDLPSSSWQATLLLAAGQYAEVWISFCYLSWLYLCYLLPLFHISGLSQRKITQRKTYAIHHNFLWAVFFAIAVVLVRAREPTLFDRQFNESDIQALCIHILHALTGLLAFGQLLAWSRCTVTACIFLVLGVPFAAWLYSWTSSFGGTGIWGNSTDSYAYMGGFVVSMFAFGAVAKLFGRPFTSRISPAFPVEEIPVTGTQTDASTSGEGLGNEP